MKDRQYLKKSILLCGESDGNVFKRTFTIVKKLDEGASSICYEAYHGNSGRGVLKEFYPRDAYGLDRTSEGQLIHSAEFGDAHDRFLKAERNYIEPYMMLLNAKQRNSNQDLSTFIPSFEIYHGCDKNGNIVGTTYIWTPEPKLKTFDKICDEIHKHPNQKPEHKLVTVLSAIESLTKCVCALHSADMIHRDIKPSNFGFIMRQNETLTQTLSMFDINSVCSVYGDNNDVFGTEGYSEPEARFEPANNQTDIFSIGATLFHAIIVTDEVKKSEYLYQHEYYSRIHELIDESKLIQASEANSHPRLRKILATILKKCLCERTYRYSSCEELLSDLEMALYYALPSEIAQKKLSGEKWVLADIEKSLDINKEKNSSLAIQYHLYEHPLYQSNTNEDDSINVLVIGFGNYGQKFLDACLQAGQIRNKNLRVSILTDDLTDKEIYLSERPELSNFFNIDDAQKNCPDSYGEIRFEKTKLQRGDRAACSEILQDFMCEYYDNQSPHYIFIALGDDSLNKIAADACKTVIEVFEMNCSVSFICEKNPSANYIAPNLHPLYINQDFKSNSLYNEIERMAFNTHLVWEKNLNVDYKAIKTDFRKKYNHDSCISNVLSLKYKLFSVGIDLDTVNFEDAAKHFVRILTDKSNNEVKNELIWVEHRRWVTEKLCLGWRRIDNLEDCSAGLTKDEKHKRHVCILKSRPDQKLSTKYYKSSNYYKWDNASSSDLEQLDELDRMSIELHRMFVKKAEVSKTQNLLYGNSITGIRALIEGNKKAVIAFQEWFTCLKDIWNGDRAKVHLYKGLRTSFLNAAEALPDNQIKALREQVKAFEILFYPILASMEYRDWKQDDTALVENIPFVLTYTAKAYMVIPFAVGDNTRMFSNVAAPTVVNPDRIIYLYHIEKKQDLRALKETIPYVIGYMSKKHFRAAVEFILLYKNTPAHILNEDDEKELIRLGKGRIRQIKHITEDETSTLLDLLKAYLAQRCAGKHFFAIEKNSTELANMLQGSGMYNAFPHYQFNQANIQFSETFSCDMLEYINKKPYITVSDMAAFRLSSSESSNQPEFFNEYKELWAKYHENSAVWKQLCNSLGDSLEKNDLLVSFKKKSQQENVSQPQTYRYIIPFACKTSVERIIQFLKTHNIAEPETRINEYTTDSCEVIIADKNNNQENYKKLFSNVYPLMQPDAISVFSTSQEINIVFDNLVVSEAEFKPEYKKLMYYFESKGYVINLKIAERKMSFTYATRQIKELLTTAGKMLEVYTYHKIKESGWFNDVVSSYEIEWEDTSDVKNEFDCILTKGFQTIFVECKARANIEQEFYFKLKSLTEQFGINAKAVLIADTGEKNSLNCTPVNDMQRRRGNMMDVVTIWKQDEIKDISQTLKKVINGTYETKED